MLLLRQSLARGGAAAAAVAAYGRRTPRCLLSSSATVSAGAAGTSAASGGTRPAVNQPKSGKKKKKKQARLAALPVSWPVEDVEEPPMLRAHEVDAVNRLFRVESKLITSTASVDVETAEDFPDWQVPEVAFAGRSNAGKSSLINALTGQKGLVRTSKTPGRTQQLHFFSVGGKVGSLPTLALVDMPGFGFASVPKRVVDDWHALVGGYVEARRGNNLKNVYLLVDARRGLGPADRDFMDFLQHLGMIYQVVFTKADTVSASDLERHIRQAQKESMRPDRVTMNPIVQVSSVKENFGIRELQRQIVSMSGLLTQVAA